jgi:hypothetical protein
MKQLIISFLIFFSLNANGQDVPCSDDKLKAVFFLCNSSPNDTAFKHLYYYNDLEQLERIEKYKNNKLVSVIKNFYDSNNVLEKTFDLYPDSIQRICGTMGIANRAMNLMQRLVQEINIAEAFASANYKMLN